MTKLIALDDGHGRDTPGKRSPDGILRENAFNSAVVAMLDVRLRQCGFKTLLVAPTDADTPLSERVQAANRAKADLYLSVHANAAGSGGWSTARGIETYHAPGSKHGRGAAIVLHRHLVGGTKLPDRGVKEASFYVLVETDMPAVLVECAFMTNREDAALLLSDAYRVECAEELARGICELYGVSYAQPLAGNEVRVVVNGKELGERGELRAGVTRVPLREIGEAIGARVGWDPLTRTATLDT